VKEGKGEDELGRVCFLKIQGTRTPVVVVGWKCEYVRDDGLSFGFPADDGWFVSSYYRDATEDEAAALVAKDTAQKTAKDTAQKTAKDAQEEAEKVARAPLEGLTRSDSLMIPQGTMTLIGSYKSGHSATVRVTKIELNDGRVVYQESAYWFDDGREYIWATPEVLASLYEERLAQNPISLESAQEYLSKYSGCYGEDIYKYVVGRSS
jgi:hypothetical protein